MTESLFTGLKVIDCGSYIAAPAATTIMADFGADVIKIEPPGGDPYRSLPSIPGNPQSDVNFAWMLDCRSKRGVALNLGTPEGQQIIHRLVADADVFVTNFPLRVRDKLRVDYDTLSGMNERLVYGSFTGYGEVGEEAGKPGFDMTAYWARSGMMDQVRSSAVSEPARAVVGQGDHPSATSMYAAVVSGLYQREKTGKGCMVASSLLANGLWANAYLAAAALSGGALIPRPAREQAYNALSSYYKCGDGNWLILTILNEDRYWPILAECLGHSELLEDPRFASRDLRLRNATELVAVLDAAFGSRDRAEWERILHDNGIIFDIVARPSDIPDDQQVKDNGYAVAFPESPQHRTVDSPFSIRGVDKRPPGLPPTIGQHTDEVLRDNGYTEEEIAQLRAVGAVA